MRGSRVSVQSGQLFGATIGHQGRGLHGTTDWGAK